MAVGPAASISTPDELFSTQPERPSRVAQIIDKGAKPHPLYDAGNVDVTGRDRLWFFHETAILPLPLTAVQPSLVSTLPARPPTPGVC